MPSSIILKLANMLVSEVLKPLYQLILKSVFNQLDQLKANMAKYISILEAILVNWLFLVVIQAPRGAPALTATSLQSKPTSAATPV